MNMRWSSISWGSIVAGAVTVVAVSMVMGVLGMALGFTVIDPLSSDPFDGLGMTFGVWSFISLLVSLAAGGFVAGMFAGVRGGEHGFMVWGTSLILGAVISGLALGTAVKAVGSVASGIGSGVATVASGVGEGAVSLAASAADQIQDNVNLDLNFDDMGEDVASVLRDTGVETLQPAYLKGQMREARADFRKALTQMRLDPDLGLNDAMSGFLDRQSQRLGAITRDIDKDAAVNALMANRGMSREEAEEAVDNAVVVYNRFASGAREAVDDARQELHQAQLFLTDTAQKARVKADEMAGAAARSALWAGLALIAGAVVCCLAGHYGSYYWARDSIVIEETKGVEIPIARTRETRLGRRPDTVIEGM